MSAVGQVSAVVISWNGGEELKSAVASLRNQSLAPAEVVVVDNGSVDGSAEWLGEQPDLRLLRNPRNLGFAVAANQGIRATAQPQVLLCNQDLVLDPGFLAAACARMERDPEIGSVGGRLRREGLVDTTGHLLHRSGWVSNRGSGEPDDQRYPTAEEVFGVSAAAVLYRRAMLEDVALSGEIFCESFFAYLEDVDLDFRARWRGWRAWYEPAATAAHRRGGSGLHRTAAIERHVLANRALVLVRNAPRSWWSWPRVLQVGSFLGLRLGLALRRHPLAVLGALDAARGLAGARAARRQIMARRSVGDPDLDRWARATPWRSLLRARRPG